MPRKEPGKRKAKPKAKAKPKPKESAPTPTPAVAASMAARAAAPATVPAAAPEPVKARQPGFLFDDPRNVRRLIYALFAVCGVSLALDLVVHRHADHPWESLFGFYAVYGLVGFTVLVLVAKELRKVLMRREDYYDE